MIDYDIQDSIFGKVLIACHTKGICSILFGNDEDLLIKELQSICPKHKIQRIEDNNDKFSLLFITSKFINRDNKNNRLGAAIEFVNGTPFQRLVWENLLKIPHGTTMTYSDLAAKIGMPRAVRAVASACGKNPVSIIVPCHRIVPKSGGIGKYRWGSEMKAKLIERETLAA